MRHVHALFLAIASAALASCAASMPPAPSSPTASPVERQSLAPRGVLRVGVYPGSPVSMVRDPKSGEARGISVGIGKALAARLGVPFEMVEFARLVDVVEAVRDGRIDLMVTNATAARTQVMDFSEPLAEIDQGYLVLADSPFRTAADVDRDGVKVKEAPRRAPCRRCCNTPPSCPRRPLRMPKRCSPDVLPMPSPRRNRSSSRSPTTCRLLGSLKDAMAWSG